MGCDAKDAATWILTDCIGVLRKDGKTIDDLTISAEKLFAIIKMVNDGTVNRASGKKILIAVVENDVDPISYCKEQGLDQKFDTSAVEAIVVKAIEENPQSVQDFKNGKTKALQALFGACMKKLKGAGDPAVIKALLEEKLK